MKTIKRKLIIASKSALCIAMLLQTTARNIQAQTDDAALVAKAKRIHDHVIKLDTHNDIEPSNFTADCNYTMRLKTQVNLPKMIEGDMDVSFMIVYVGQGPLTKEGYEDAYRQAVAKFDAIHRLTEQIAPDKIGLALKPADVIALHKKDRRVAVIAVENGYPIGDDIKRVKEFYDRGARYMSLAHNGNSQLADSNTGEAQGYLYNNGLSPLGRQVIAEMNRLGMMVDLSHPSKGANLEAIRLSKAPVIASHSGVRALGNVSRNMDDELLMALKKNGGVIQVVGFASYIKPEPKERIEAIMKLREEFGLPTLGGGGRARAGAARRPVAVPTETPGACPTESAGNNAPQSRTAGPRTMANFGIEALSADQRSDYEKRLTQLDKEFPPVVRANVKDFIDQIDYAVKKVGIDHVGIASDFDGGGGIDGWNSAAEAFNVTLELVRRGYTEKQIGKLWSGNLLHVWGEVDKVAAKLQKEKR